MRTENEIKALPLEEKQKLVTELRAVNTGDKAYANAKAIIELITSSKGWKEPALVEVKNIAGHDVTADNITIAKDATAKVFPWQLAALARFLEPIAKAAAMIALLLCLFGFSAAANTTANIGSPGSYQNVFVAGLNGGTNNIAASTTASYIAPVTNVVSITTNANWTYVNGQSTNTPSYVTNTSVVVPGLFAIANFEDWTMTFSSAEQAGATNSLAVATVDYSTDNVNWQTNKWTLPVALVNTGQGTTNLDVTGCAGGWARLNSIANNVSAANTNEFFEVSTKPQSRGP